MATSIKDVHDYILDIYDAEVETVLRHSTIDRLLDAVQMALFYQLLGGFGQLSVDDIGHHAGLWMLPFTREALYDNDVYNASTDPNGMSPAGIIVFPDDFFRFDSARASINQSKVLTPVESDLIILSGHQVSSVTLDGLGQLSSDVELYGILVKDLVTYDVNAAGKSGVKLIGSVIPASLRLRYYIRPSKPVYSFTLNGRQEVFDSGSSTNLEWDEDVTFGVIVPMVLERLGVKHEDRLLFQYGLTSKRDDV